MEIWNPVVDVGLAIVGIAVVEEQERARGETQTTGTAEKPVQARRDDPVR